MRQLDWSSFNRFGISVSTSHGYVRRFAIMRTTGAFVVIDNDTGDTARPSSLAAARAWAGIRVGEECVRHGDVRSIELPKDDA